MYGIAICDDNWRDCERIEGIIRRVWDNSDELLFYTFSSGDELVKSIETNLPIDLLILDMQMPGFDGDATAAKFRLTYPDAVLIFCSGVYLPTVKSFESNAYRFLLKEYSNERLYREMRVILQEMKRRADVPTIAVSFKGELTNLRVDEILYVTGRKYGSSIYVIDKNTMRSRVVISNTNSKELFQELSKHYFRYAHNSYYINLFYVVKILNHEVELKDGTKLTVSRSKEKEFRAELASYIGNKY